MIGKLFGGRRAPAAKEFTPEEVRARVASVDHWYHRIEVAPGIVTPGVHSSPKALELLDIPERMDGQRVLDIGARDGFFSFAAEARGAEVLAVDAVAMEHLHGFRVASELLGSTVEYRTTNVYNLDPKRVGTFDAIFFLGVLYHLRDPMLGLDRLWSVAKTGATIWVESHTIDNGLTDLEGSEFKDLATVAPALANIPIAQFYPKGLLGNSSNWWGPNLAALEAMVETSGFEVLRSQLVGTRGIVVGRKVENPETDFWRDFDRAEGTGEQGMAWEEKTGWSKPKKRERRTHT